MSWHSLKEVCRARATGSVVPPHVYRGSSLTRVLAECLTTPDALVTAVATISPCAKDTEHTLCTLRTVQMFQMVQEVTEETEDVIRVGGPARKFLKRGDRMGSPQNRPRPAPGEDD